MGGALTLLPADAKVQGPRLFNQHCASCHDFSGESLVGIARPEKPTAADLSGFAGQQWLTEFLSVKGISSPKFFGNTKFKRGKMFGFLKETFSGEDMPAADRSRSFGPSPPRPNREFPARQERRRRDRGGQEADWPQ